jgi:hypothetical protein
MNPRCKPQAGIKKMFEDSKNNGVIQSTLGTALHIINDFQCSIPLTYLAVIQSSTFESAL